MRPASGTLTTLLVARCAVEGVLFASIVELVHAATGGTRAIALVPAALVLCAAGIVLASALREARADRQHLGIALGAMTLAALSGLVLAPSQADGLARLTRVVAFAIVGEAFVWRDLTVARSLVRWTDTRNAGAASIVAVGIAAVAPGAIDRDALAVLALLAVGATAIGLSLARAAEELLGSGRGAGEAGRGTASGTAVLLAGLSLAGAALAPLAGELLAAAGRVADAVLGQALYDVLLVLGYVAALVVELFRSAGIRLGLPPPATEVLLERQRDDAAALRQIEATRPFVIGAVELIVAAVALLVVVLLLERMARERREALPAGATIDRAGEAGEGLGALLAGLLPRRAHRPRQPRDDGTPAGALRALYWRYLARVEAAGLGWRAAGETPAEHQARAGQGLARFRGALPLVTAFEALRYAERPPDPATLARAREALAAIEAER